MDNYFTGKDSSLIYANNIQVSLFRNKFINNGKLSQTVTTRDIDDSGLYITSKYFTFKTYSHIET
jgi:hypothetical protein